MHHRYIHLHVQGQQEGEENLAYAIIREYIVPFTYYLFLSSLPQGAGTQLRISAVDKYPAYETDSLPYSGNSSDRTVVIVIIIIIIIITNMNN